MTIGTHHNGNDIGKASGEFKHDDDERDGHASDSAQSRRGAHQSIHSRRHAVQIRLAFSLEDVPKDNNDNMQARLLNQFHRKALKSKFDPNKDAPK